MCITARVLLGLAAIGAVAPSACSQGAPVLPAVPSSVAAPAQPAPAPQQQGQGQGVSGNTCQTQDQVEESLGRRSSEGAYWPPSIQLGGSQMGNILYDGCGFPLYLSTNDSTQPPASHCTGECAQQFLPVLVSAEDTYQNVDASHIGTVERSDNMQQLTCYGHPVYRNLIDLTAGQVTANGYDDTWFAITVTGSIAGSR